MRTTVIPLKKLYEFIYEHKREYEQGLDLNTRLGKEYSKCCKKLTKDIPETQGIYIWGCYDKGKWRTIYVGQAGRGKTSNLRARILEELKDERCCLWRAVCSEKKLYEIGPRVHPKNPRRWEEKIKSEWNRALRKAGTTHIVWSQTDVGNKDVRKIEAVLIEEFDPEANKARLSKTLKREKVRISKHLRQNIRALSKKSFTEPPA
jgi:hypothetical protein